LIPHPNCKNDFKIFDKKDPNTRNKLQEGKLIDTSEPRGDTNINIKEYKNGFTG
jgi:hypothetical protein